MSDRRVDLPRVGLSELGAIDFRVVSRDYWAGWPAPADVSGPRIRTT